MQLSEDLQVAIHFSDAQYVVIWNLVLQAGTPVVSSTLFLPPQPLSLQLDLSSGQMCVSGFQVKESNN